MGKLKPTFNTAFLAWLDALRCFAYLLLSALFIVFNTNTAQAQSSPRIINIQINPDYFDAYETYLNGRDPHTINQFKSPLFTRLIWELLVFQTAPTLGKCQCEIKYMRATTPSNTARSRVDTALGRTISAPIAGYISDTLISSDQFYYSKPILDSKDFYVGIYTHESRKDILALKNLSDIKALRFSVVNSWPIDKQVLKALHLKQVETEMWKSTIEMIKAKRSDVLMQPFAANNELRIFDGSTNSFLYPINNIKILFQHSRRYFISKRHPDGKGFVTALDRGIEILTNNGHLKKMAMAAGFYNPIVQNWPVLNAK